MKRGTRILACCAWVVIMIWPALPGEARAAGPAELFDQAREKFQAGQMDQALALSEAASREIWNQMGLKVATALLVKEESKGYGLYNPRGSNVYPPAGEPVLAYVEVAGYKVAEPQPGLFAFGVHLDVAVVNSEGRILWGKENFIGRSVASRRFIREMYFPVKLTFKNLPPGDYTVKLTVRDKQGGAPVEARLPIKVQRPGAGGST